MLLRTRFAMVVTFLSLLAEGAFAIEKIDCIDYKGDPDERCVYSRFDGGKGVGLFVVGEGQDLIPENALPGESFYVYAPMAGSDTVDFALRSIGSNETEPVENMMEVNSGESGIRVVNVRSIYPAYNVVVGTAADASSEPAIAAVYNFYAPEIEYYLDKEYTEKVSDQTKLQLEVGDTLAIYVRAVFPIGPMKGETDSTLNKSYTITTKADGDNLKFLSPGKKELDSAFTDVKRKNFAGYLDSLSKGKGSFLITATGSVKNGADFTTNMYRDDHADGTVDYVVKSAFPGNLQFVNPDMPSLDSAFIFDISGDGIGDSIAAYFGGNIDVVDVKSFSVSWPDDDGFSKFKGDWTQRGYLVELLDVETAMAYDSGKGSLRSSVESKNSGETKNLETEIQDRIGPVILGASKIRGIADTDTLVIRFSKKIDESWTSGKGFIVSTTKSSSPVAMEAIDKQGDLWTFVLDSGLVFAGDSIQIATTCAKKACPDGLIKAADGNETGKNNPAVVSNSGRLYMNDDNNFFDVDGDGRMDSVSVAFDYAITEDDKENMEFTFYWLNGDGQVVEIKPETSEMVLSEDGMQMGYAVDVEKYDIKPMLTSIDNDTLYGYAEVVKKEVVDGEDILDTIRLDMGDRMSPVISATFLEPESFQKMEADKFTLTFSEPVEVKESQALEDCFEFFVDGEWVVIPFNQALWSDDGRSVVITLENGVKLSDRMNPADSLRFNLDAVGFADKSGNGASPLTPPVMVEGDPRVLMEATSLASLDRASLLADKAAFTERFVLPQDEIDDEMKKSLGVKMDISFATILNKDAVDVANLDLERIGLKWELYVYTNLGAHVAGASGTITCDDRSFNGNCFENARQLYLRWNMRSDAGRKVGVGVYVAQFRVKVFGANESFETERIYNWGVRAGKDGLSLGE
ncbi:hypothetical protein [Fibrobacter sp.]|uniref:hypothetical protein n=1 Tax=Fibrobacter sp. TaxID=35828 RepID=UPI00388E4708